MKHSIKLVVLTISLGFAFVGCNSCTTDHSSKTKPFKIGIVLTEPHPVLNTIVDAYKARLKEAIPDAVFIERNANGSKAQIPATVRSVLAEGVDLLVPVTTPMSIESLSQASGRVPVVFLGVTDPIGAQIVSSLEKPVTCTGVSDNPPMNGVVDLVREIIPSAKSIGIPFDPKDQPGVITAERTASIARSKGLQVELRPVTSENDLRAAVRSLASNHDAIVIGMDNLMMKNAGIIAETAKDQGKPLFAADDKSAEMGAIAAMGVDYREVGNLGAEISIKVLRDKIAVGTIPVAQLSSGQRFFNDKAAAALKITVPLHSSAPNR